MRPRWERAGKCSNNLKLSLSLGRPNTATWQTYYKKQLLESVKSVQSSCDHVNQRHLHVNMLHLMQHLHIYDAEMFLTMLLLDTTRNDL
jgi:hypothetical protein